MTSLSYKQEHTKRFQDTLDEIQLFVRKGMTIGNVGISDLDEILSIRYSDAKFFSIIPSEDYLKQLGIVRDTRSLLVYDLCRTNQESPLKFDLIIFTEVLEHMFIEDEIVLQNLYQLLTEGGILLLSVPNAATLRHRLLLLLGKNIFWSKKEITQGVYGGYGHIREYTFDEVEALVSKRFGMVHVKGINGYRSGAKIIFNILPKTFANTILVIAQKERMNSQQT